MGKCLTCSQVVTQQCDDKICDIQIPAKCVTVEATDCTEAGKLQDVIEELCDRTGEGVETEKGMYTINSVCTSDFEGDPHLTINVTPNFSLSTPTFIAVSGIIDETSYETVMINLLQNLIPSITDGVSFDIELFSGEVDTLTLFTETNIQIRVVDNEGNYSELTTITPTTC